MTANGVTVYRDRLLRASLVVETAGKLDNARRSS